MIVFRALGEGAKEEFNELFDTLIVDVCDAMTKYSDIVKQLEALLDLEKETLVIKKKVATFNLDYDDDLVITKQAKLPIKCLQFGKIPLSWNLQQLKTTIFITSNLIHRSSHHFAKNKHNQRLLNFTLISGFRIRELDKHFQHWIQQSPGSDENHSSKEAQSNATDSGETWT